MSFGSRKAMIEKMEAQLKEWSAMIEAWQARAQKVSAEARGELRGQVRNLREKQDVVRSKLTEMKGESDAAWDRIKAGAEKAWGDMKTAVEEATAKFK